MMRATLAAAFAAFAVGAFAAEGPQVSDLVLWTHMITDSSARYCGWPTLRRLSDGELRVVFSGGRQAHVCPYGKVMSISSRDDGDTWTAPEVLVDSPLDDRDAGLLELRDGTLVLNWFTSIGFREYENYTRKYPQFIEHYDRLDKAMIHRELGDWCVLSKDRGKTWTKPIRRFASTPHGGVQLKDGRLLTLGRLTRRQEDPIYGEPEWKWRRDIKIVCEESRDGGLTWRNLAMLPTTPGTRSVKWSEPHLAELEDGTLVGLCRFEDGDTFLRQAESHDGGRTWTAFHKTDLNGFPAFLSHLPDGRLLVVYGSRQKDRIGEYAALSSDGGRSWDVANEICIARHNNADCGYPSTAYLGDGMLLTVYYAHPEAGGGARLFATKWRVPAKSVSSVPK